jgi:hypothetical protein
MIGAVANGIPWLGHEVNQSGRAALILGEGGFDLGERLSSWLYGNPGATDDRMLFSVEEGLDSSLRCRATSSANATTRAA